MKRTNEGNQRRVGVGAILTLGLMSLLVAVPADARDDKLHLPILDAMSTPDAKAKLNGGVRFYFGKQAHPAPTRTMGEYTANKKTNFFNKSDKDGCEWAFLSAAISLQERARQLGGNAVINIRSAYKNVEFSSETQYECGAGTLVGGVVLRGDVAQLP